MNETLSLAEAAEYLKLGYEATKELFHSGELPGVSLNQRHAVFLRTDLEAFLRERARIQAAERRADAAIDATPRRAAAKPAKPGRPVTVKLPDLSLYETPGAEM